MAIRTKGNIFQLQQKTVCAAAVGHERVGKPPGAVYNAVAGYIRRRLMQSVSYDAGQARIAQNARQ